MQVIEKVKVVPEGYNGAGYSRVLSTFGLMTLILEKINSGSISTN